MMTDIQEGSEKLAFGDFVEYIRDVFSRMVHVTSTSLDIRENGYASIWATTDIPRQRDGEPIRVGCTLIPADYDAADPQDYAGFFVAYMQANIEAGVEADAAARA